MSATTSASKPSRRGPSIELQRQIDDAIAARSQTSQAYDGTSFNDELCSQVANDANRSSTSVDEPGIAPPGSQYEYLDHPADILLHSWGNNFLSCLINLALAMFGCITSLPSITIDRTQSEKSGRNIVSLGHDARSLVYSFLDEWLFNFHDSGFIPKQILIEKYDAANYAITSWGDGEVLDVSRHPRGVEVKAITYNAMRVEESEGRWDIYVVVDI